MGYILLGPKDRGRDTEPALFLIGAGEHDRVELTEVNAGADDSSGIIGDACHRLLDLHPKVAAAAKAPAAKLIDRVMKFQLDSGRLLRARPCRLRASAGAEGMAT